MAAEASVEGYTPTYVQTAQIVLSWLLRKIRSKRGRDNGTGVGEGNVGGLGKGEGLEVMSKVHGTHVRWQRIHL